MKKNVMWLALILVFLVFTSAQGQETQPQPPPQDQPKPLEPGVLGLESTVGLADKAVERAKSNLENAWGIGISGFFDSSYTVSSNHPGKAFLYGIS